MCVSTSYVPFLLRRQICHNLPGICATMYPVLLNLHDLHCLGQKELKWMWGPVNSRKPLNLTTHSCCYGYFGEDERMAKLVGDRACVILTEAHWFRIHCVNHLCVSTCRSRDQGGDYPEGWWNSDIISAERRSFGRVCGGWARQCPDQARTGTQKRQHTHKRGVSVVQHICWHPNTTAVWQP